MKWQTLSKDTVGFIKVFSFVENFLREAWLQLASRKNHRCWIGCESGSSCIQIAAATLLNTVLASLSNCHAYLDDLSVHTMTWEEHIQILEQVFTHLAHAALTLNLVKCEFGKATHLLRLTSWPRSSASCLGTSQCQILVSRLLSEEVSRFYDFHNYQHYFIYYKNTLSSVFPIIFINKFYVAKQIFDLYINHQGITYV